MPGGQVVHGADAGEDAIRQAQARRAGRHPAAHLGHQLQQAGLTEVAALAAGVGSGEHQQIGSLAVAAAQGDWIGPEGLVY